MGTYSNTREGNQLMAVSILLLLFVSIIVPARFYVRIKIINGFGSDDWATLLASILSNAFCAFVIVGLFYGFGKHIKDVPPKDYTIGLEISWITQLLYIPSICMTKISVSLFIKRLTPSKLYTKIASAMIIFMITYSNVCWFFILIQCHPFKYIYDKSVDGRCLDPHIGIFMAYFHSAANIATDLSLLGIVIAMMWNVKMAPKKKFAVYGVFALGTLASVASIIKIPLSVDYGKKGDFLFDVNGLAMWSMIEVQTGIIATSLPILKPLYRTFCLAIKPSDPSSSNDSEAPHPLQFLSPARNFSSLSATKDNESEQCMVPNNPVQTPKTPESRIKDAEEGRYGRAESAGSESITQ